MVKVIQIKLNHNWAAGKLLTQTAVNNDEVVLISELSTGCSSEDRWCYSSDCKPAIGTTWGAPIIHNGKGSGPDEIQWPHYFQFLLETRIDSPGVSVVSYGPREGARPHQAGNGGWLQNLECGWRTCSNNPRDESLSDLTASFRMVLAKTGISPTLVRDESTSVIDVTFYKKCQCARLGGAWHPKSKWSFVRVVYGWPLSCLSNRCGCR